MALSLLSDVLLWKIVVVLTVFIWIHDGDSLDELTISPTEYILTLAVEIDEENFSTDGIQQNSQRTYSSLETTSINMNSYAENGNPGLLETLSIYSTPSFKNFTTNFKDSDTFISTSLLSQTIEPTTALFNDKYPSITNNNELVIKSTVTMIRTSAPISPTSIFPLKLLITDLLYTDAELTPTPQETRRHLKSTHLEQLIDVTSSLIYDDYLRQFPPELLSSSRIPTKTNHGVNLMTDKIDELNISNTSVNFEWTTTTELLNLTTIANNTNQDSTEGEANPVLIIVISVIIGLCGISALILRIGNRWKKRVIAIEEKRRERLKDSNRQVKADKSMEKPLTIRMPSIVNVNTSGNQSFGKSSFSRKSEKKTNMSKRPNNKPSSPDIKPPKRNRTLEALVEIGALPEETLKHNGNGIIKHSKITSLEKDLLSNIPDGKWSNAFDNMALDFDSQEEIYLKRSFKPVKCKLDGKNHDQIKGTMSSCTDTSDDKDSSAQSFTELTLETSETENATDRKRTCNDKRRKNVKFARRSSSDSGFIDNIQLSDIRSPHIRSETIIEELTTSLSAGDSNLDYSDDSQPDRLGIGIMQTFNRDRSAKRGSKRKHPQIYTNVVRHGDYSDADQSSSETGSGGNETASDDQNLKLPLVPLSNNSFAYENELAYCSRPTSLIKQYNYFRRMKPRDHRNRYHGACDASTQTTFLPVPESSLRWMHEDQMSTFCSMNSELDYLGPVYLAECLLDVENDGDSDNIRTIEKQPPKSVTCEIQNNKT